jgi:RNA polymerase sigma-54 factor
MIELKHQLKIAPQLILTPQLKLLLKILQLNTLELNEFLLQEVQSNPFLELEYNDLPDVPQGERQSSEEIKLNEEIDLNNEEFIEKSLHFFEPPSEEGPLWEKTLKAEETLTDYLLWQVRLKEIPARDYEIAQYIVGNLDEKGYLRVSPGEIAKELNVPEERVEKIRNIIKFLDPVGVASYDVKECLITQLEFLGYKEGSLPWLLIEKYLEEIPRGVDYLSEKLGFEKEEVEEALEVIRQLDPYPARNFFSENTIYIEPDLIFYKEDNEWKVEVVRDRSFSIKLNEYYKDFLKIRKKTEQALKMRQFLREKLRDAENLLKALDSRYSSLYRVGEAILKYQKDFLEKGIKYLKPLTLRVIAEEIQLHESTVSRIISHKYVQTPDGVYPLKFFFSTGYKSSTGTDLSAKAVKDYIKEIIKNEDPRKPLSDNAIAKILKEKYGINIARRTVTKYREELQIPSIRERKLKNK